MARTVNQNPKRQARNAIAKRKKLEKYLTKLETRNLAQKLELLRDRLSSKIDPKIVAQLVREDREER